MKDIPAYKGMKWSVFKPSGFLAKVDLKEISIA